MANFKFNYTINFKIDGKEQRWESARWESFSVGANVPVEDRVMFAIVRAAYYPDVVHSLVSAREMVSPPITPVKPLSPEKRVILSKEEIPLIIFKDANNKEFDLSTRSMEEGDFLSADIGSWSVQLKLWTDPSKIAVVKGKEKHQKDLLSNHMSGPVIQVQWNTSNLDRYDNAIPRGRSLTPIFVSAQEDVRISLADSFGHLVQQNVILPESVTSILLELGKHRVSSAGEADNLSTEANPVKDFRKPHPGTGHQIIDPEG